jgi:hypothetical protein
MFFLHFVRVDAGPVSVSFHPNSKKIQEWTDENPDMSLSCGNNYSYDFFTGILRMVGGSGYVLPDRIVHLLSKKERIQ